MFHIVSDILIKLYQEILKLNKQCENNALMQLYLNKTCFLMPAAWGLKSEEGGKGRYDIYYRGVDSIELREGSP